MYYYSRIELLVTGNNKYSLIFKRNWLCDVAYAIRRPTLLDYYFIYKFEDGKLQYYWKVI